MKKPDFKTCIGCGVATDLRVYAQPVCSTCPSSIAVPPRPPNKPPSAGEQMRMRQQAKNIDFAQHWFVGDSALKPPPPLCTACHAPIPEEVQAVMTTCGVVHDKCQSRLHRHLPRAEDEGEHWVEYKHRPEWWHEWQRGRGPNLLNQVHTALLETNRLHSLLIDPDGLRVVLYMKAGANWGDTMQELDDIMEGRR